MYDSKNDYRDYLAHANGERRTHKYIAKVKTAGGKIRYFYNQAAYAAWKKLGGKYKIDDYEKKQQKLETYNKNKIQRGDKFRNLYNKQSADASSDANEIFRLNATEGVKRYDSYQAKIKAASNSLENSNRAYAQARSAANQYYANEYSQNKYNKSLAGRYDAAKRYVSNARKRRKVAKK